MLAGVKKMMHRWVVHESDLDSDSEEESSSGLGYDSCDDAENDDLQQSASTFDSPATGSTPS